MRVARGMGAALGAGGLASLASLFAGGIPFLGIPGGAVALGLAPGLALALAFAPGERVWITVARALALSPLVSGAAAVILLAAGVPPRPAAALIVALNTLAGLVALGVANKSVWESPLPRWERRAVVWGIAVALLVLLPHAREWVRVRSDAVFHTAVVLEIGARGAPPGDPYFAGVPLNYLWFYHALLSVWSGIAGVRAWDLGGALNATWILSLVGAVYSLSRHARRPAREAFFATLFVPLGMSAFFYLWFPVKLARGLLGRTAGAEELRRLFDLTPLGFDQAWHVTSLFHSPPAFLNKYLVMTAWGGGVLMLVWLVEALMGRARTSRALADPAKRGRAEHLQRAGRFAVTPPCVRWGPLLALAAFGSWVWHPAVGLAAGLSGGLAFLCLLAIPGSVGRFTLVPCIGWYLLGTAPALPLLFLSVGNAEGGSPIGVSPAIPAILIGSTAALLLGIPALLSLPAKPPARLYRVLALSTAVVSIFIVLPGTNTHDKLPFVFYLLPATAAGWTLGRWWDALARRGRIRLARVLVLVVFLPVNGIYLAAYLLEQGRLPGAEERALYDWIRTETEPDAVFVDTPERAEVLVYGERRLYFGRESYAFLWGYDPAEMERRRAVRERLTGAEPRNEEGLSTAAAVEAMEAFRSEARVPVYLVWRPRDHGGRSADGRVMAKDGERFRRAWSNEEATVFRLSED